MFGYRIFVLFALVINAVCLQGASVVNRWKVIKNITTPEAYCRSSVAQISDDTAVHIAGSALSDVFIGNYSASLHRYDATTRSFEKYNVSLPTGRIAPNVVTVGKKVYIFGGGVIVIAEDTSTSMKYLDDMYEFDPIESTLDNVTVVGLAPIPMIHGSAAEVNDDQFVYFSAEGPYWEVTSDDIWSFNVKSKQWTIQGKMPSIMASNAAVTLRDHFGVGKHGVFLLGGSGDFSMPRSYDNRAWILNPESWEIEELPTDGSSGVLPWGESHTLTTEKIQGGTRVWAFGAEYGGNFFRGSNTFQFLDIPEGAGSSSPKIFWQLLPIVNPDSDLAAPQSFSASYMLHRRAGMNSEPHILGACYELGLDIRYFANKTYSVVRNDAGANGAQSLLYDDTNHSKDGDTISIQAGKQVDFRLVAYDADGEQLDYGKLPVTSFLTHTATQQRIFAKIYNMQNGSWYLSYTPAMAGTSTLEVFLNGEVVNNRTKVGLPINVNIIPSTIVANHTKFIGNGVTNPTAGTWSALTIQLKDTYNNTVLRKASELANISVTILPNFSMPDKSTSLPVYYTSEITDAGIEIMYRVNHTGSYKISTFVGDNVLVSSVDVDVVRDPIVSLDPPAYMNFNIGSPEAFATSLLLFLSLVGVILCGACMIGIITYKDENIIKAIDVTASLICLSGLMILFCSGFFWVSGKPTIESCIMWPFFHSIGFGIVFSTLSGKIWHVYTIFTTKNIQRVSKWNSIIFQGSIILIDLILCITWSVADPLRPAVKYPDTYFAHEDCSSSSEAQQKFFLGIIGGFNALLGIIGLAAAYLTRNLPSRYNQAAHVAISMESFIILLLFALPALDFMDKYMVPKTVVRFLVTWVPAMITTVLLFGSRVYIASTNRRVRRSKGSFMTTSKTTDSQVPSFVKYLATTKDSELPGEAVRMEDIKVFWCQEQWLRPNIWFKSTMFVVPSIGILTFTDHDYVDAHMIVDTMNAKLERIPANMDFQHMLRLRTKKNGAYLIGAFSSSDLEMIESLIKTLIANHVDCLHLPENEMNLRIRSTRFLVAA